MKRSWYVLCALVITLAGCSYPVVAEESTYAVVCTNSILADFSEQLLPDAVSIDYIMPAGACPSHFDTRPSDVSLIATADVIVSLGWEPWLDALITASGNTDVTQIRCSGLGEWNVPSTACTYVETLRDNFILMLPEENATIKQNAETYLEEINTTASSLQQSIISNGLSGRSVICIEWYHEVLSWLGFTVSHAYGPPEGLSTQDMLNVTTVASEQPVCAIIDNLQSGTEFGARIAAESGASHVIFTNFPQAVPGADTYLEMMEYNTNQLITAISTYDYRQGDIAALSDSVTALELERNIALVIAGMLALLTLVFAALYKKK